MNIRQLEYFELNESGISDNVINNFDCGNKDMSDYLHKQAREDTSKSKCITYVLLDNTKNRIYAYATISAYAMYYYEDAEKYHTVPVTDDGQILVTIPAVEIKMFAIDKALRGQTAFLLDPDKQRRYSTIFFQWFLEKLYYMSMSVIGFQMIFLRANTDGYKLYINNGFARYDKYINTYDAKSEDCIPLISSIQDTEEIIFST